MKMRLKAPQIVKFSAARAWTGAVTWRGIESSKCLNYDGVASSKTDPLASHPPVGPGRPWRSPHSIVAIKLRFFLGRHTCGA